MSRPTYVTIDQGALKHNLERVRQLAPGRSIIAMVKANAYGHGMVSVAKALASTDAFGVASIDEGVALREAGIKQPIVLMEGAFHADELTQAEQHDLSLVVHHSSCVDILEKAQSKKPFSVWLKINTGMHRLGCDPKDVPTLFQRLTNMAAVKKPIGLMTHFAEADMLKSAATKHQMDLFKQLTNTLTGPRSLANSAGILAWPDSHGDWVRPGLMLYGVSPIENKTGFDHDLKPVMSFTARIIAIEQVKKGGKVGYGGTWTATEDTRIAVVSAGYGDGYPQAARNGTPMLVSGVETQLVGRVSMDMLTVNLHHLPNAQIGDEVTLWGNGLPVERVAQYNTMSVYELLTRMTSRPIRAVSR
jgi:alanine racemase